MMGRMARRQMKSRRGYLLLDFANCREDGLGEKEMGYEGEQ